MESLNKYTHEEQKHIINIGMMVYDYNKNKQLHNPLDISSGDNLFENANVNLGEKVKQLQETIRDIENTNLKKEMEIKRNMYKEYEDEMSRHQLQLSKVKEDAIKESEQRYEYLKNDLERERNCRREEIERFNLCLKGLNDTNEYLKNKFESEMEDKIESRVMVYKEEINNLKEINKEYFDKYENKNKGKIFEEEFYKLLEEYNDKEEGNKWKISHVGSKYGGMCDIIFKHKDTGDIIMVESKNNLEKNPVPTKDVDKFYRDVLDENNNAVGGIIVSTAKIQKKRSYERELVQNKVLIFISHFSLDNIGQLFCNLETIVGENKYNNNELSKEDRNALLVKQYDYYNEEGNFHKTRSKRSYDRAEEIREIYYKLNKEDIKLLKTDEKMDKKIKKVKKEKKHQDNEINYACLEENCDKIKKINNETQTKCYLKHKNEKGEIILQYFQDNYKTKKRLDKLESDGNEIITHSMLKKGEKVLKKSKIVNNIKINTIFD